MSLVLYEPHPQGFLIQVFRDDAHIRQQHESTQSVGLSKSFEVDIEAQQLLSTPDRLIQLVQLAEFKGDMM